MILWYVNNFQSYSCDNLPTILSLTRLTLVQITPMLGWEFPALRVFISHCLKVTEDHYSSQSGSAAANVLPLLYLPDPLHWLYGDDKAGFLSHRSTSNAAPCLKQCIWLKHWIATRVRYGPMLLHLCGLPSSKWWGDSWRLAGKRLVLKVLSSAS